LMTDKLRRNRPKQAGSLGAVPAQIYKLVCLRIRTFEFPIEASFEGDPLRNGINLTDRTPSPEAPGDRAAAHMSLHLTDNVKEPTHLCPRYVLFRVSLADLKRHEHGGGPKPAAAAAVRGHIWVASRTVNSLFQKIRSLIVTFPENCRNPGLLRTSGRLYVSAESVGLGLDPLDSMLHQVAN